MIKSQYYIDIERDALTTQKWYKENLKQFPNLATLELINGPQVTFKALSLIKPMMESFMSPIL